MKFISALRSSLVLAGLLLALPVSAADQAAPAPSAVAQEATPKLVPFALEIRNGTIIENDKEAGTATIGNILEYMKKHAPPFSIVLGPGVADYEVRDLVLHLPDFSAADICAAISASSESDASSDAEVISAEIRPGIFALSLHNSPERSVQVYNLGNYLNPNGDATDKAISEKLGLLREIIEEALDNLAPSAPRSMRVQFHPQFQFHRGANLLVVTGTNQALEVASKVINALVRFPVPQRANASSEISPPPEAKPAPAPPIAT